LRLGVLPSTLLCLGACGKEETIKHLFLGCDFFGNIWNDGFCWLGICFMNLEDIREHALQFSGADMFKKEGSSYVFSGSLDVIYLNYLRKA